MTMAVISNSTHVECTPEEAFDYLVDMRNELEWNPDVVSMEKITDGPIGVGTTFRAKWKQSKLVEVECLEFDRPRRFAYRNGGPVEVQFELRIQPEAGGSRLLVDFDARPKGLFRVVFPLFMLVMRRAEKANMTRIRSALEGRVAAEPLPLADPGR
jgi:hypothetical protein